jgi:hypothetical protein
MVRDLAEELAQQIVFTGTRESFHREYEFHPTRKWRFDLAWPELMVAFECEGGVWSRGRHTRPQGFAADIEKYNTAVMLGWSVYRVTAEMIHDGTALRLVEAALLISMGRRGDTTALPAKPAS